MSQDTARLHPRTSSNAGSSWDFSAVYDLINSLSQQPREAISTTPGISYDPKAKSTDQKTASSDSLGNFDRVWDYLGVQQNIPHLTIPTFESSIASKDLNHDAYVSDGALYYPASSKTPTWKDRFDASDYPETQDEAQASKRLTKTQRKKLRRKAKKRALLANTSDDDIDFAASSSGLTNLLNQAHTIKSTEDVSAPPLQSTPTQAGKDESKETTNMTTAATSSPLKSKSVHAVSLLPSSLTPSQTPKQSLAQRSQHHVANNGDDAYMPTPGSAAMTNLAVKSLQDSLKKKWPIAKPLHVQFEPSKSSAAPFHKDNSVHTSSTISRKHHDIHPLDGTSSLDRNWSLLNKLLRNHPEDRKYLLSPLQLSINQPHPHGIHVFVDASNILIGFHEHLKRVRGLPVGARIGRVDLAFHSLALLLERRRPVAKRVLAGSTPEIPAYEEARQIGYETNILDKVLKAKELTERQRKFASQNAHGNNHHSASAGSDTDSSPFGMHALNAAKPRWVEQAVDEILHLKILESIVDNAGSASDKQSGPTMVLATGDAAEAEYSEGFMKQVERALKNGWHVEVVAWGASISHAYRRWQKAGKANFKVIELDDYVEELFGLSDSLL